MLTRFLAQIRRVILTGFACLIFTSGMAVANDFDRDRYLRAMAAAVAKEDWAEAQKWVSKLAQLGVSVPDNAYYFAAEVQFHNCRFNDAQSNLGKYINRTGTTGDYIVEAGQLANRLDAKDYTGSCKRKLRNASIDRRCGPPPEAMFCKRKTFGKGAKPGDLIKWAKRMVDDDVCLDRTLDALPNQSDRQIREYKAEFKSWRAKAERTPRTLKYAPDGLSSTSAGYALAWLYCANDESLTLQQVHDVLFPDR